MRKKILGYVKLLSDNEIVQNLLVETIGKILFQQNNFLKYITENKQKIIHIRDWISSIVENNEQWKNPRVLTIDALNNAADKYFEKKINRIQTIELNDIHEKLIADLGDYYVVQMLTPEALDNESKIMQHCIGHGGYDKNLKNKDFEYLSLRDRFNKAHATVEIYKNEVFQLQGKQNKVPDSKYLNILIPWLIEKQYVIDLMEYKMIKNMYDNKIYSVYKMPDNCKIDNGLSLLNVQATQLPSNLKINGFFEVYGSEYFSKIKNLEVNGYLKVVSSSVYGNYLFELPENLKLNKDLYFSHSNIKKLPVNFHVNGNLDLNNCKDLQEIPNGLSVEKDLILANTEITKIPSDIKIGRSLILSNSNVKNIPDNLVINGDLDLYGCDNLEKLPKGLVVKGSLNLSYTNIKELPEDIIIGESIILSDSKIEKLPDNLIVNGDLHLNDCLEIKKLEKIIVKGNFKIIGSNIENLGENSKISGSANLSFSKIKKLPDGLIVEKDLRISYCDSLEEIGNNIVVGKNLKIENCSKLEGISEKLDIKGIIILDDRIFPLENEYN